MIIFKINCGHPNIHSFPTRRSSDLKTAITLALQQGTPLSELSDGHSEVPTLEKPTKNIASIKVQKGRSEEHTSELQSRLHLVCRLLLEKKKKLHVNLREIDEM